MLFLLSLQLPDHVVFADVRYDMCDGSRQGEMAVVMMWLMAVEGKSMTVE